jgi:hypothetical protein
MCLVVIMHAQGLLAGGKNVQQGKAHPGLQKFEQEGGIPSYESKKALSWSP